MKRKLRPLLPAEAGDPSPSQASAHTGITKRTQVSIACEECRKRKIRCDGNRPSCWPCRERHVACVYPSAHPEALKKAYAELSQEKAQYEGIYKFIQTRPRAEADEIFRRIRAGVDVGSLLRFIEDGDLVAQAVLKPDSRRRRYEFPYHSEMPIYLFSSNNPYLDSLLFQSTFSQPITADSEHQVLNDSASDRQMHTTRKQPATDAINDNIMYLMPYSTAQMIEPTIEKITAEPWTRVISDNKLLRRLVCSYFQFPHACGSFVHKDLFLEDMVACRNDFCSPLLVNAMLSIASVRTRPSQMSPNYQY